MEKRYSLFLCGEETSLTRLQLRELVRLLAEELAGPEHERQPYKHVFPIIKQSFLSKFEPLRGLLGEKERAPLKAFLHEAWTILLQSGSIKEPPRKMWQTKSDSQKFEPVPFVKAFVEHAISNVFLVGRFEALSEKLATAQRRATGEKKSARNTGDEAYEITPKVYARLLKLGPQDELARQEGDYIIFRRHSSLPKVVISYMEVRQWNPELPARFETSGGLATNGGIHADRDHGIIRGVLYVTPDDSGIVFALGRYVGTRQIRLTILERVPNSDDLVGLRLGISGNQPAAYHVWCSKLAAAKENPSWTDLCGEYDIEKTSDGYYLANDDKLRQRFGEQAHQAFASRISTPLQVILENMYAASVVTPLHGAKNH